MSVLNFRSLMLSAAAAAAATTAQAADLPVAPEPVDYVRVCDAYGARFYYIPGTETCLRVGGRVRTQFIANNVLDNGAWGDRDLNGYGWVSQAWLYLDARTATEFGTLRAFASLSQKADTGSESMDLDKAYIQWGGLTAGYATSNFDIYTGQVFMGVVSRNWSDKTINQVAYTRAFGNGFSATLAIEDAASRQTGGIFARPAGETSGDTVNGYGGTRMPDIVAALSVKQGWGEAQLSGALHQVYPDVANNNPTDGEDQLGWAIGGGVSVNLPMASPGSNLFFQAQYADGALSYIGVNTVTVDGFQYLIPDYVGDDTSSGYSLSAGAYIQATNTIGLALDGSYMDIDTANSEFDLTRYAIDGSVVWEPVSGFQMGADIGYANSEIDNIGDQDELLFGVRMQRTF